MDARRNDKYTIILLGLVIHVLLLFAVFDVYFASPLDNGMIPVKSTEFSPAKRLILFVADGLRAEAVFGNGKEDRMPYLIDVLKHKGAWGVAHTRVPTESRPGHVAMLAGIYEDPSAILKGWKANPVYFDSVINQSVNAWCWGSPDVVNIFNRDGLSKIRLHTYGSDIEDFGEKDTALLDTWVFDKVEHFLKYMVHGCTSNCDQYYDRGNLFFLHLLGIDTAGHGFKPHSKEYVNNIKLVDKKVEKITRLAESIFQDNNTVYVFTSDHGMTNWGSHGAGSLHETEVPLIVWGAGIKKNSQRQDIQQIDLAPLISSLIGITFPINSLGIIPTSYLDLDKENLTKIVFANTKQLLEIFNVKRLRVQKNALIHVPYKNFNDEYLTNRMHNLKTLITFKEFNVTMIECQRFMQDLIQGIHYYHNYYQYPILLSISFGFLFWILHLIATIFCTTEKNLQLKSISSHDIISGVIILIVLVLCLKSNFPFSYFLYFSFPFVMLFLHQRMSSFVLLAVPFKKTYDILNFLLFYFVGIELLVYGFFNRMAFSVLMILISLLVLKSDSVYDVTTPNEKLLWICSCLVLSVFPALPVMKTSFNIPVYVMGYVGWLLIFGKIYWKDMKLYGNLNNQYKIFVVQFSCLQVAAMYVLLLENGYISNDSSFKYISWLLLIIPIIVIPKTDKYVGSRLLATFFGFAPFYLLVSPNFEVLFSVFYVATLCIWLLLETKSFKYKDGYRIVYYFKFDDYTSKKEISSDNFRRAFLFMVFIFMGFFGTGNIASLNSFDPMWVRAFLTVFSPFKMMGLIILKLMVPFIFTCCVFRAINAIGRENVLNMFCIILVFSDLMVLQFLYLITNQGSWLDIGSSLSHFLIMEGFVMILLLLYGVAHWITSVSY